jgi:UDP-N-acetylmuramoyl-L-alanyl-D-glutamate--2,6-diaminopimelate ligase
MTPAGDTGMDLRQLLAGMNGPLPALEVPDIAANSAEVVYGGLFLACQGARQHGLRFAPHAIGRGASAIAWEPAPGHEAPQLPPGVVGIEIPGLRTRLGDIANRFFAYPSQALAVTGITGTNGKTTTAWLATQAFERLGRRAAYLGTLGHGLGGRISADVLTTPDCINLHRRLREFAGQGACDAVIEVSSHALDQGRVDGVRFRIAAFTNLSRDHLDYHGNLARYREAKARLFRAYAPERAVINVGDEFGRELAATMTGSQLVSVAVVERNGREPAATLRVKRLAGGPDGQRIRLLGPCGSAEFSSPLWGAFNSENLAVAAGILLAAGFALHDIAGALAGCTPPPGRMERIGGGQPRVIVDFAHTPDALRRVLQALREHAPGRIWCVFGCGGERDRGKRAEMGAAADELADRIILTDDNPRNEDPARIIRDIRAGIREDNAVEVVRDRAAAIAHAIRSAAPDDIVLVAGKGHESVQIVRGVSRPFSDQAVARSVLDGMA